MAIPTNPSPGEIWTNDATGVNYRWDNGHWVAVTTKVSTEAYVTVEEFEQDQKRQDDDIEANTQNLGDIKPQIASIETDLEGLDTTVSSALDAQADLELRIESLEGTVIDGKWTLDNRSAARPGMFLAKDNGLQNVASWDQVQLLQMSKESKDGGQYTFGEVGLDDVIRIGGPGGSAAFKVIAAPQISGDNYNIGVSVLKYSGVPAETITYDFEFLPSFDPSTYATIEYVDSQDSTKLNKSGGTLTGGLKINMPGYTKALEFKRGGDRTLSIYHWNDQEIRTVVDEGVGFKLNSTVGGNERQLIGVGSSGNLGLYHVRTPTNRTEAANMGYVDDQISGLSIPDTSNFVTTDSLEDYAQKSDLDDYAKTSYVDNSFVRMSMFKHYLEAPARLQWRYSNVNNSNQDPGDGYFRWQTESSSGSHYLRCSLQTNTQANIGNSAPADMNITIDNGPIGSIWYWAYQEEEWRLKEQFRINTIRWNYNNHVEFRTTSRNGPKSYTNGTNYFITVGGFF